MAGPEGADTLVGREAELHILRGAVDRAVEERSGSVVLLSGEAGIGKSRLAAEAAAYAAARGCLTAIGRCYEEGALVAHRCC